MTSTYSQSISIIRMLATQMIVVCHMFLVWNNSELYHWFNLGVQLFFLISGYLLSSSNLDNPIIWLKRRIFRIMSDYWCFLLILLLIGLILHSKIKLDNFIVLLLGGAGAPAETIASFTSSPNVAPTAHLWFVTYIVICYAFTPLLQKFKCFINRCSNPKCAWFWLLCCAGSSIVLLSVLAGKVPVFCHSSSFACYILGYCLAGPLEPHIGKKYSIAIFLFFLGGRIALRIIELQYLHLLTFPGIYSAYRIAFALCTVGTGTTMFFLLKDFFTRCKVSGIYQKILLFSDRYSYDVYLVHQPIIHWIFAFIGFQVALLPTAIVLIIVTTLIASVLLRELTQTFRKLV